MRSEQEFNQWLARMFNVKGCDFYRVENTTGNGCPDINVCFNGCEAWIEAKWIYGRFPQLRKEQYAWGMRRSNCGGVVIVAAYRDNGDLVELHWFPRIRVQPTGDNKKLHVTSNPDWSCARLDPNIQKLIHKIVFPML